ncbi:MAG: Sec-independent protein translocase protein TatB [Candidatus Nanopelagicales bacterium]
MFDIGLGELIVLAILALLVFGPDQLPKVAAQAGRFARQVREMAGSARKEISDSAGLDEISSDLKSLADLHPRKLAASVFNDGDKDKGATPEAREQPTPGEPQPSTPAPSTQPAQPSPPPASDKPAPQAFDPDAT